MVKKRISSCVNFCEFSIAYFLFTSVQAQRLQMKLYAQLQVQPTQRAVLAEKWRSWCRRRRGLDMQLLVALQHLQVQPSSFHSKTASLFPSRECAEYATMWLSCMLDAQQKKRWDQTLTLPGR
jgi:hypothetical protein